MCELTGELYSVQEERDSLVSARAVSSEDNERLKGETLKAQEQRENVQKDAELKEMQLSQQLTETTEELVKVQTDLQHLLEENRSLLNGLEETKEMVGTRLGLPQRAKSLKFDYLDIQSFIYFFLFIVRAVE